MKLWIVFLLPNKLASIYCDNYFSQLVTAQRRAHAEEISNIFPFDLRAEMSELIFWNAVSSDKFFWGRNLYEVIWSENILFVYISRWKF